MFKMSTSSYNSCLNHHCSIRRCLNWSTTACENVARDGVQNTHDWRRHWRMAATVKTWTWSSLGHSILSCCFSSSISVMRILYIFSCNRPHTLLSTGFKSGEFGGHSCIGIYVNSGVSLPDNAVVTPAWWAFQVLEGSVQTLFKWGGKRLHYAAANVFRILYTKFHQNRPGLMEYITNTV